LISAHIAQQKLNLRCKNKGASGGLESQLEIVGFEMMGESVIYQGKCTFQLLKGESSRF